MKEFEFTKGEWSLHKRASACVGLNDERVIANCGAYYSNIDFEKVCLENDANAKLISSAPNLLYALIDLVEIVDNLPEDRSILTALENAKKAIDKATK